MYVDHSGAMSSVQTRGLAKRKSRVTLEYIGQRRWLEFYDETDDARKDLAYDEPKNIYMLMVLHEKYFKTRDHINKNDFLAESKKFTNASKTQQDKLLLQAKKYLTEEVRYGSAATMKISNASIKEWETMIRRSRTRSESPES